MAAIEEALDTAKDKAADLLNAEGRHPGHVLVGALLTVGFAFAVTTLARRAIDPQPLWQGDGGRPVTERPRGNLSLILPAVFSATTLSALRVWNAPPAQARSRAIGLWTAAQAMNAVWIALRPASRGLQIAAAMSTAGMAAAFAHEARKVDVMAGKWAAPIGGGVRLANTVQEKVDGPSTLH